MNRAAACDTRALHRAISRGVARAGSVRELDPNKRFERVPLPGAFGRALREGGHAKRFAPSPEHTP
jgi:hypothetical protein